MNIGLANGVILNQSSSDVSSLVHIPTMDELATVFETFLGDRSEPPSKYFLLSKSMAFVLMSMPARGLM